MTTGYSGELYKKIIEYYKNELLKKKMTQEECENQAREIIQKEILWADVTTDLTNQYVSWQFDSPKRLGMWNIFTRNLDPLVIQILFYVKDKGDKQNGVMKILQKVDAAFKEACSNKPDKVVVIAHSLGSVIAYDYIFGFRQYKLDPNVNIEALITLGSPIPIFTSAMGHVSNDIILPPNVKKWLNVLDPDDGVARYCKQYFKNVDVKDIEVNTGFWPLGAHSKYWRRKAVAKLIAENLIKWGC